LTAPLELFSLGIDETSLMKKGVRKDLFPGALEMMILQTLRREPLHGYALVQHIKRASNDLLQVEEGSLYPALQRMLKEGWVTATWRESANGRRIRVYRITAAGARHLEDQVSHFERMLEGIRLVLEPAR
jgi:PadR family transcriptional regulator PadR